MGAAEGPSRPLRDPGRHAQGAAPRCRCAVAGLPAQGGPGRRLRRQPGNRRRHGDGRPLLLARAAAAASSSRALPRSGGTGPVSIAAIERKRPERQLRRTEQQDLHDDPPSLRVAPGLIPKLGRHTRVVEFSVEAGPASEAGHVVNGPPRSRGPSALDEVRKENVVDAQTYPAVSADSDDRSVDSLLRAFEATHPSPSSV